MQAENIEPIAQAEISQEQPGTLQEVVTPIPKEEDAGDINWRKFREQRKKERAEKEAIEKRMAEKEAEANALKAAMDSLLSKQQPAYQSQQTAYGYQEEETQEQIIMKHVEAAIAAREQQYQQQQAEREQREYPQRLQQAYPDFNKVVSQENLDYLDYHYPELSQPFQDLPEGFKKWDAIYKAVKRFVPNHASAQKDAAKAQSNLQKPQSMSSTTGSQMSTGPGSAILSRERRQANWERMQKTLKGVSG